MLPHVHEAAAGALPRAAAVMFSSDGICSIMLRCALTGLSYPGTKAVIVKPQAAIAGTSFGEVLWTTALKRFSRTYGV